ncbi:MAG: DNA polymerase/3'-5' exonuclease PolX [Candidatus Bilamarchaeaceae archaeon]
MKNLEVARILYEIADMLEAQNVQFKPVAYRKAARAIEELPEDITSVWKRGELEKIPGVGSHIAMRIAEYLETGRMKYYDDLKKEFPIDFESLGRIEGLGPKRAITLYKMLGIRNLDDLKKAVEQHKIRELPGFGEKSEQKLAEGIELAASSGKRMLLSQITPIAQEFERKLRALKEVEALEIVGSYRRRKETVGDLDILVVSKNPGKVMDFFVNIEKPVTVLAKGLTKSSILLSNGLHVDLRVLEPTSYGSAMLYFTGSKEHNIALRTYAMSKGMKLSEYGLFKKEKKIAGRTEEEVYEKLGLKQWIPPELRENMGEIEAAIRGNLPQLVELKDVRGDLHVHTNWSEGRNSLEEMAMEAKNLGYEYVLISDHGGSLVPIARCMNENKILEQGKAIDALNKKLDGITLLKGCETNIKEDGSIDVSNATLKTLDIAITGIHTKFKMPKKEMTKRIITAMENEHIDIIAHPTGRLIGSRPPIDFDFDEVLDAARRTGTILEINACPERLDLDHVHIFKSRGKIKFSLGTDAHEKNQMRFMEFGIAQARRGWCERKDMLNTLPLKTLRKIFGF